jgi:hypothetical protein
MTTQFIDLENNFDRALATLDCVQYLFIHGDGNDKPSDKSIFFALESVAGEIMAIKEAIGLNPTH